MILPPPSFFNEISFENDDCDPKKKKREEHVLAILALIAFASMLAAVYVLTDPNYLEYTEVPIPAGILWFADAISILSIILILFLFYDFFVKKRHKHLLFHISNCKQCISTSFSNNNQSS